MSEVDTDALAGGMADAVPGGETTAPASTSGTLLDSEPTDKPVAAPADWPDDWRLKLAGEDKSYLKTLDRFNSPNDLAKAYRDAQQRLSSGNLRQVLPDNPSAEELAAWRAENGVPDNPKGYEFTADNGYQWNDADRAVLDEFSQYALENNIPASVAKHMASFYASKQAQTFNMIEEFDERAHQEAEDSLRSEWGQEYRRNMNAIRNVLSAHAPEDVLNAMLASRTPTGKKWGDDPAMLKVMASLAREANPSATVAPSTGYNSTEDELSGLEKFMRENRNEWFKDSAKQERYRELIEARDASRSRGRAA